MIPRRLITDELKVQIIETYRNDDSGRSPTRAERALARQFDVSAGAIYYRARLSRRGGDGLSADFDTVEDAVDWRTRTRQRPASRKPVPKILRQETTGDPTHDPDAPRSRLRR